MMSSFQPVILWTDGLIYFLLVTTLFFIRYAAKQAHFVGPWRHIRRRPLAMAALVVLSFYLSVGLLDSIHFRAALENRPGDAEVHYDPEVLSLLDLGLGKLKNNEERSYSSPFATRAFSKEMIEHPDGTQSRGFPRLRYGGAHLKNPEVERTPDLLSMALKRLGQGLFLFALIVLFFILLLSQKMKCGVNKTVRMIWRGECHTAWLSIIFTTGLLFILMGLAVPLSTKYHLLGTDKVGQDVLYLALKGIRTGLVIGTLTTLVMLPFAVFLGISAGYFRGKIDDIIQYLYTTLSSIPGVLLIAASVLMLQVYMDQQSASFSSVAERADIRLLFLCIILGVTSWVGLCRLLRAETLKLREMEYVQAAKALGVKHRRIITHHILPNVMHLVLISVVLEFSGLVLAEAVLAYIGVGVDPAMISWGNMINSARLELAREPVVWWSLSAAFVFMFALVLSANVFSDAVRDAFDPRLRGRS